MKTEMATTRKRSVKVCARKPEREEELTAGGETMGSYKYCMCFTRKFLWNAAQPPADVREAFAAHAGGAAQMGADQLQRFLAEAQGEAAATLADAERIVDLLRRRHHLPSVLARAGITLDDFFHFLFSDDLNPPVRSQVVIISTKPPKEYLEAKNIRDKEDDSQRSGRMRDALKVDPHKVRRLSLSEQQLEKLAESHGPDIVRFTQKNILRVYPKGTRFNSSNYNPLLGWMHGAQMVKVYMGDGWRMDFSQTHFDAYSPPDFYTKVGIAGVPADTKMKKTKIKEDNWTPVWEEEFSFPLTVPELALLRIVVHEYDMSDKNDFGGQTCLPVWELRPGIRAVPLHDRKGNKYKSVRLLMRFQFE
ncbi:hypothetical protein BHE74_00001419 [Ensete ventricosum]|nr:hypothetical protein BHE74_00001419 [Ensete ventricosum]